jgi:KDO2-lipid IV(A) lauroyltransferase
MARKRNAVLDFLAFLPQGAFLAVARVLPWHARLAFGSAALRAALAVAPDFRRRIEGNLQLVFPDMTPAERRRVRRECADNFGRTFVETFSARAFQARAPWSAPAGPGWEALEATLAEGKGALLVGGHFGQWEAVRGALKARGIDVGALYRPMNNPWLERTYIENMTEHGAPMLPRGGPGMRELIRHLRAGGVVAVLLDQYVVDGTQIDFLGHPAPTGTAIAALAERFRVPMIPAYGTRDPDGVHITIDFEAPIPHGSAEVMTQAAADSLAARVRAVPGQYYWLHRRWVKRFEG